MSAEQIPSLHINCPSSLSLSLDDITLRDFFLRTEGDVSLPPIIAQEVEVETISGKVAGSFNVTRSLILRTVTSDIDAEVHVIPMRHDPSCPLPPRGPAELAKEGKRSWWPYDSEEGGEVEWEMVEDTNDLEGDSVDDGTYEVAAFACEEEEKEPFTSVEKHHSHSGDGEHAGCGGPPEHKGPDPRGGRQGPGGRDGRNAYEGHGGRKGPGGPGGPPPHPAFIGAFSSTGSINLTLHQPPSVSSIVNAFSRTGDLKVTGSETFKGFFKAGTSVGNLTVSTRGDKEIRVFKRVVREKGGFVEGVVVVPHRNGTEDVTDFEVEVEEWIIGEFHE